MRYNNKLHSSTTGTGKAFELTETQEAALSALWAWRDLIARSEDERYVRRHMQLKIILYIYFFGTDNPRYH